MARKEKKRIGSYILEIPLSSSVWQGRCVDSLRGEFPVIISQFSRVPPDLVSLRVPIDETGIHKKQYDWRHSRETEFKNSFEMSWRIQNLYLPETSHAYLVKLLSLKKSPRQLYLISEYCSGCRLSDYLNNKALPIIRSFKFIILVATQLISTLYHFHNQDQILGMFQTHDIFIDSLHSKQDNKFVHDNDLLSSIKLKYNMRKHFLNRLLHFKVLPIETDNCCPPELLEGKNTWTQATDMWCFGAFCFELLQGHPLVFSSSMSQYSLPLSPSMTHNQFVPESLSLEYNKFQSIILLCLNPDPCKRPPSNKMLQYLQITRQHFITHTNKTDSIIHDTLKKSNIPEIPMISELFQIPPKTNILLKQHHQSNHLIQPNNDHLVHALSQTIISSEYSNSNHSCNFIDFEESYPMCIPFTRKASFDTGLTDTVLSQDQTIHCMPSVKHPLWSYPPTNTIEQVMLSTFDSQQDTNSKQRYPMSNNDTHLILSLNNNNNNMSSVIKDPVLNQCDKHITNYSDMCLFNPQATRHTTHSVPFKETHRFQYNTHAYPTDPHIQVSQIVKSEINQPVLLQDHQENRPIIELDTLLYDPDHQMIKKKMMNGIHQLSPTCKKKSMSMVTPYVEETLLPTITHQSCLKKPVSSAKFKIIKYKWLDRLLFNPPDNNIVCHSDVILSDKKYKKQSKKSCQTYNTVTLSRSQFPMSVTIWDSAYNKKHRRSSDHIYQHELSLNSRITTPSTFRSRLGSTGDETHSYTLSDATSEYRHELNHIPTYNKYSIKSNNQNEVKESMDSFNPILNSIEVNHSIGNSIKSYCIHKELNEKKTKESVAINHIGIKSNDNQLINESYPMIKSVFTSFPLLIKISEYIIIEQLIESLMSHAYKQLRFLQIYYPEFSVYQNHEWLQRSLFFPSAQQSLNDLTTSSHSSQSLISTGCIIILLIELFYILTHFIHTYNTPSSSKFGLSSHYIIPTNQNTKHFSSIGAQCSILITIQALITFLPTNNSTLSLQTFRSVYEAALDVYTRHILKTLVALPNAESIAYPGLSFIIVDYINSICLHKMIPPSSCNEATTIAHTRHQQDTLLLEGATQDALAVSELLLYWLTTTNEEFILFGCDTTVCQTAHPVEAPNNHESQSCLFSSMLQELLHAIKNTRHRILGPIS